MLINLRGDNFCFLIRCPRSVPPSLVYIESLYSRLLALSTLALLLKHPFSTAAARLILFQVHRPILLECFVVSTSMMAATWKASTLPIYNHDTLVLLSLLQTARIILIFEALSLLTTIVTVVLVVILIMQVI